LDIQQRDPKFFRRAIGWRNKAEGGQFCKKIISKTKNHPIFRVVF
jgi:hypothetical protein